MPPDGNIAVPLADDEVKKAAELFASATWTHVFFVFLFSFLNKGERMNRLSFRHFSARFTCKTGIRTQYTNCDIYADTRR